MDRIIAFLLRQNASGWRGQALMLKQSGETGVPYFAAQPNLTEAIRNQGNTGLLDTLAAVFEELSTRASHDPVLYSHVARWLCKETDPRLALRKIAEAVAEIKSGDVQR